MNIKLFQRNSPKRFPFQMCKLYKEGKICITSREASIQFKKASTSIKQCIFYLFSFSYLQFCMFCNFIKYFSSKKKNRNPLNFPFVVIFEKNEKIV